MNLVTLTDAKRHLLMDHADDDVYISSLISAASGAVLTYLKGAPVGQPERDEQGAIVVDSSGEVVYERDSSGTLVVRYEIRAAALLLIGELYKNREAEQDGEIPTQHGYGYLPRPVVALLYPLRDPASV